MVRVGQHSAVAQLCWLGVSRAARCLQGLQSFEDLTGTQGSISKVADPLGGERLLSWGLLEAAGFPQSEQSKKTRRELHDLL